MSSLEVHLTVVIMGLRYTLKFLDSKSARQGVFVDVNSNRFIRYFLCPR